MKPIVVLLSLLIAGCAAGRSEGCHAPAYGLNPGHWRPSAADLKPCSARHGGR